MTKIGNIEVDLNPSAYTLFEYLDVFDKEYIEDLEQCRMAFLKVVAKPKDKNNRINNKEFTSMIKVALQLAYIMQDDEKKKASFKQFSSNIRGLMDDSVDWVNEVIQTGYKVFRWNIQQSNESKENK